MGKKLHTAKKIAKAGVDMAFRGTRYSAKIPRGMDKISKQVKKIDRMEPGKKKDKKFKSFVLENFRSKKIDVVLNKFKKAQEVIEVEKDWVNEYETGLVGDLEEVLGERDAYKKDLKKFRAKNKKEIRNPFKRFFVNRFSPEARELRTWIKDTESVVHTARVRDHANALEILIPMLEAHKKGKPSGG